MKQMKWIYLSLRLSLNFKYFIIVFNLLDSPTLSLFHLVSHWFIGWLLLFLRGFMLHGNIIAITIMDEVVAVINSSFSSVLGGATGTSLVFIVHQSLVSLKHSMDQLLGGDWSLRFHHLRFHLALWQNQGLLVTIRKLEFKVTLGPKGFEVCIEPIRWSLCMRRLHISNTSAHRVWMALHLQLGVLSFAYHIKLLIIYIRLISNDVGKLSQQSSVPFLLFPNSLSVSMSIKDLLENLILLSFDLVQCLGDHSVVSWIDPGWKLGQGLWDNICQAWPITFFWASGVSRASDKNRSSRLAPFYYGKRWLWNESKLLTLVRDGECCEKVLHQTADFKLVLFLLHFLVLIMLHLNILDTKVCKRIVQINENRPEINTVDFIGGLIPPVRHEWIKVRNLLGNAGHLLDPKFLQVGNCEARSWLRLFHHHELFLSHQLQHELNFAHFKFWQLNVLKHKGMSSGDITYHLRGQILV